MAMQSELVRSSSPASSSSSPSLQFSNVSAASSATDLHLSSTPCCFVAAPECKTVDDLTSCLRSLPVEKGAFMVLAVGVDRVVDSTASLSQALQCAEVVVQEGCHVKLDVKIQPDAQVPASSLSQDDILNAITASELHSVYDLPFSSGFVYVLENAPFSFPSLTQLSNPYGPPTREEWQRLWKAWDLVTLGMIPPEMLHQKPIDLRHKCLFYIGHIPTFVNMLLSHLFKEPYTEPKNYTMIFERGIDPHVDDPDHCHSHSEVPERDEDWPTLEDILAYRDRIRARLMSLYDDIDAGRRKLDRTLARVLQMTLEHEGFHIETLLYMLIQRAGTGTLPPPGFTAPPWAALADKWSSVPPPSSPGVVLGPTTLVMGHDDAECDDAKAELADDVLNHAFGWDNESPRREVEVDRFRIDWRPISNAEFYAFWNKNGRLGGMPGSWAKENDEMLVRTVHGPVPMSVAGTWPVLASYDQLKAYAKFKGGRLPTEPELRLFLDKYQVSFDDGANVGFRNWHPVAPTAGLGDGSGSNGGVWEWTSTSFEAHTGMSPTKHFPGYSTDFFDGKHQVVLGASYATIPRLAERRTVRNFYQHNYPYAWVGARVAYDA